ncbi:La-domain-containing protein, partial [Sistotremastrum niveocremeum HHB9708]
PVTATSFPLDENRRALLGQIEYYFGDENVARDTYLREQMDSQGWVPIGILANFNRVRSLTSGTASASELIKDVMSLSSLLEVRNDHVRLNNGRWRVFILPTARPSIYPPPSPPIQTEVDGEEEEDEDDVVFVMG